MTTRQTIIVAVGVLILMILAGGFFAGMPATPPPFIAKSAPKYVKTTPVVYSDINTSIITYGRVQSAHPIDLIAEVSGRILQGNVPLKEGQDFSKGTLLYRLEDDEARLNLKSQKSNFLRDLATILADLKIDFPDSYPQWNAYFESIDINKSLPEMPQYKSDQEKTFLATKNIFSNYFDIKRAETSLSKHLVYAPFSGSFSEVLFEPGAYVNPGSKIGRIIRKGSLELIVPVDASDISWIKKGALVQVTTEDERMSWEGRIQRVGDIVNQTTHSIDVSIEMIPNEHPIYHGLYLKAEIPGVLIPNAMEIDRSAVYSGSEVFTVESDSILKVKRINPRRVDSRTVIFNGLEEGEMLVTEPLINAHNNMIVTTIQDSTNAVQNKGVASGDR